MKQAGVFISILGMLVVSCVPVRKVAYVQDDRTMVQQQDENMYFIDEDMDEAIRPGDELFIEVTSSDEGPTNFSDRRQGSVRDASVVSYSVDEDGYIKLPYINKIKLSGLTLFEASDEIENELSQYLYTPSVFIRFVNNKVTILGEVENPGVYVFNYKNINILQAIGYAGDISTFGNRQNVLIVREQGDYRSKFRLDLTSDKLLVSPFYMVKSNDIIYVEPLRSKKWGMDTFPYNLLFSTASIAIVLLTFLANYYY